MKVAEREEKQARSGPLERAPPPEMREVPWEWAKDEIGVKVTVMLGFLTRHLLRAGKDEMRVQVKGLHEESPRLLASGGEDDVTGRVPAWQRAPP
jgi:hypothetical protein